MDFLLIPPVAPVAKPANWLVRHKNLTPEVSFRRIYEYTGGDWQEDNGVWQQNVFAYYLSIARTTIVRIRPAPKFARAGRCINVKMALSLSMKMSVLAVAIAIWLHPYGAPQYNATKGHMTKCDGCHERVADGKKPICVESCPLRAFRFRPD